MATVIDTSRVLVVDDEPQFAQAVRTVLSTRGYQVRTVDEGQVALTHLSEWRPELVITDLRMDQMDGIELCRRIRSTSNVPIIVLSAESDERTKVDALDSGADDYIMKPFGVGELLARVRAAIRRGAGAGASADGPAALDVGDFRVDFDGRRVYVRASEIRLTPKEFDLFVYMARRPNRVIPHGTLLEAVWGETSLEHREYLRVFMRQLRQKLEADPSNPRYLISEPWVGYRFDPIARAA
jgi:two-component system KDP operon response regulator KdpE